MSDFYEIIFGYRASKKAGSFITTDEGRVVFVGGPGAGGGGVSQLSINYSNLSANDPLISEMRQQIDTWSEADRREIQRGEAGGRSADHLARLRRAQADETQHVR